MQPGYKSARNLAARGTPRTLRGPMKREKRLTKRERKALSPGGAPNPNEQHIHCVACGKHLDPANFQAAQGVPPAAQVIKCAHGSQFPSCTKCVPVSQALLDEHDRSGQPVKAAAAWH